MSSDPKLADSGRHRCDNCSKVWDADELKDFCDIMQRLDPGGTVPSGECPECHALCYPVEPEEEKDVWGESEKYPRADWKYEVANGDTNQGYWDWVRNKKMLAADEEKSDGS